VTGYLERVVGRALGVVPVVRLRRDPVFADLPAGDADVWSDAVDATAGPQSAPQGREPPRSAVESPAERARPRDATALSAQVDATPIALPIGPHPPPARHIRRDDVLERDDATAPRAAERTAEHAAEARVEVPATTSHRDSPRRAQSHADSSENLPADARASGDAPRFDAAEDAGVTLRRGEALAPDTPAWTGRAAALAETRTPMGTARAAAFERFVERDPARLVEHDPARPVERDPARLVEHDPARLVEHDPAWLVERDPARPATETPVPPSRAPAARGATAETNGVVEMRTERISAGRREGIVAAAPRPGTPGADDPLTISVSIGRIEIQRPPPPATPRAAEPKRSTLDDYLRRRAEIKRR
jgi:hypothetical protein